MTTHQNAGIQLDPRSQAAFNAVANVALNPSVLRTNCFVGIAIAGFFATLLIGFCVFMTIVATIGAGPTGFLRGLTTFIFPGVLAAIPVFIIVRLIKVLKALPK